MICPHNFPYYECRVCAPYFYGSSLENSHYEIIESLMSEHKYSEVRSYLIQNSFPCHMWGKLQKIWHESYYMEFEEKGKEIKAVAKFRLRKKYPPPMSIWNGEKLLYNLPQKTRDYLEVFFARNEFATTEEKEEIAISLGMTESQVSNWFKNKRQRKRIHERKGNKVTKTFDSNLHNFMLEGQNNSYFQRNSISQMTNPNMFSEGTDSMGNAYSVCPRYSSDYYYKNKGYGLHEDNVLRNVTNSYSSDKVYSNDNLWSENYGGMNSYYYSGGVHDSYIPYSQRHSETFTDYYDNYADTVNPPLSYNTMEDYKENMPHLKENAKGFRYDQNI